VNSLNVDHSSQRNGFGLAGQDESETNSANNSDSEWTSMGAQGPCSDGFQRHLMKHCNSMWYW
jgi:hypothetical protein